MERNNETLSLVEIFGEPIHTYTRAQAIDDGLLVDVSSLAQSEARFRSEGRRWPRGRR